jgi:tRNA(Ile)-lysidine synthase
VERAAKALGVRFVAGQDQVRAPEADARESRYRFLSAVASNLGTAVVLTAHTEDDQAETVLLKLTRGAGLRGAGAIRELSTRFAGNNEIVLLRPLLSMNRGDMEAVCREARISPARDASNRRLKYSRNRIRHRVLGELERINPKVRSLLARFADNASADDEFLRQLAAQSVSDHEERSPDAVRWSKRTLRALPHPLLIRVLEDAWRHLVGDGATLGRRKLEQATRVVAVGGRVTLPRSGCFEIGPGDTATMGIIQRGQGPV